MLAALSVTGWTIVLYIVFIILLLCILAYFFARSAAQQRYSFFSGIGFAVLLIITFILLSVKMNKEFKIRDGIIIETSVTIKSSPDKSSKDEFIVHEGLKVRLEDRVDDWVKIRLEDGKIGWILEKNLGEI
jgi:hypothetical protein